ncbi:MAG TPA: toxin TcdB middle/N-terminal domain-containing protein, partial [Polyangiaceae bacterium]
VDLNGDGLADWVSVQGAAVTYAINRNGNEILAPVTCSAAGALAIPERTSAVTVRFADMNASGSTDIVWIDASGQVTYLELFPVRPNLLTQIDNGIGKSIALRYGTSTAHMLRDGGATGWHHRLPHPIVTLDSVVVRDALSGTEQRRDFHYSDGYYDGAEMQFRGFEQVAAVTPGDESVDTGTHQYGYDVGARDPYHKGLLLSHVVKSSLSVLSETENSFDDCPLTDIPTTTPAIRFICNTALRKIIKEGRPQAEWVTTQESYGFDGYGNQTSIARMGVTSIGGQGCAPCQDPATYGAPCDAGCRGDESYRTTEFVAPNSTGGRWMLRVPSRTRAYGVSDSAAYSEKIYHYDGQAFVGLPPGQVKSGLLSRVEAKVLASASDTIDLERYSYNTDGTIVESWDPNGSRHSFEYDPTNLLIVAENLHFDTAQPPYALRVQAEYDPNLDLIVRASSWMRVVGENVGSSPRATSYAYDAFGRLSAIARPGDPLTAPTELFAYELASPVSRIVKLARSAKDAEPDLQEIQCFDGLGRALQKRVQTGPDSYIVSDFKRYNVAGAVSRRYQARTRATRCASRRAWLP